MCKRRNKAHVWDAANKDSIASCVRARRVLHHYKTRRHPSCPQHNKKHDCNVRVL
jgi:hypothetical protein